MTDYGSSSLWWEDGGMVPLGDLPLTPDTEQALEAWSGRMWEALNAETGEGPPIDTEVYTAEMRSEGDRLWAVVRAELGGLYEVGRASGVRVIWDPAEWSKMSAADADAPGPAVPEMLDPADDPWRDLRVAWLAENPVNGQACSTPGSYAGCVVVGDEVVVIADDLGNKDSALAWGRARAEVVMIRAADDSDYDSVGTSSPPWWTPGAGEMLASDGTSISWMVAFPPWDMDQEGIDWREDL